MPPLPPDDLELVLTRTPRVWDVLRGKRIFLTGGTGFIGTWLVETFAAANDRFRLGCELVVLTRDPAAFGRKAPHLARHPAVQFVVGDVTRFAPPPGPFSFVIHAATPARLTLLRDDPVGMLDVIIDGTRAVLQAAAEWKPECVLALSSGAIYGSAGGERLVSETDPFGPDPMTAGAAYAEGKRVSELLTVAAGERCGFRTVVSRGFAFVGPHLPLDEHFAAGNFLRDGLRGGPIRVAGDGRAVRSYLYAADLAAWLWTMLAFGRHATAYNTGSDRPVSIRELAEAVAAEFGCSAEIAGQNAAGTSSSWYVPSIDRGRTELGLDEWTPLADAIRRTRRWHEDSSDRGTP